jgi:hypothetical protein
LLGPGYEQKFKLAMGKRTMDAAVDDLLNGTYLIDLTTGAEKKKKEPVQLLFQKTVIWKGEV